MLKLGLVTYNLAKNWDLKTILERGKTNLGDKTIADSLDLIIKKLKDNQNYSDIFKSATRQALDNFKGKNLCAELQD